MRCALVLILGLVVFAGSASAQTDSDSAEDAPTPSDADVGEAETAAEDAPGLERPLDAEPSVVTEQSSGAAGEAATQELGARFGLEAGGRTTPGGLRVAGSYLYRLTANDWLDQSIAFGFGSRDASCFRSRDDEVLCDHGLLSGFAIDLVVGIRRYLPGTDQFSPYVRGGLALRGIFFTSDDLSGIAVPLWAGAGVRAQVANKLSLFAEATLKTGVGLYSRGLGLEPHASFEFAAGAEFVID